jgi:hypothetical protein
MSRARATGHTLTLFAVGSHAKTLAAPARDVASEVNDQGSGTTSRKSSRKSGRASSSSKTSRAGRRSGCHTSGTDCTCSAIERAPWGLPPAIAERLTCESESSLWLTLTAEDCERGGPKETKQMIRHELGEDVPSTYKRLRSQAAARACLLPTVVASTGSFNRSGLDGPIRPSLYGMARAGMVPTLTAQQNMLCPSMQKWPSHRATLPTLTRRDDKGPGPAHTKSGVDLPQAIGGHLSPTFCEWLMGFPEGWTRLEPASEHSVTPSSRSARKSSAK